MPEFAGKRCLVAIDAPGGPLLFELTLAIDATVAVALAEARARLDGERLGQSVDWQGAAVGLWGQPCSRAAVPREGDRIELYRPLEADPRQRRRQRARAGRS